jgi:acetyl esterase/lipase
MPYLSMGWAVVNVEYRLGRNTPAPAAVEDCRCALRWVHRRASEHGLDTSKIVLTGGSAGGHLALITAMLPASNPYDRRCPTDEQIRWTTGAEPPMRVAAVVNWFGITDVADLLAGPNAKHYAVEWFGSLERREELARQVSPVNHVRAGLPPVITIHGDQDDLVPYAHATRLHAALERAGVPNQLVTIRGGGHGGFSRREMSESFAAIKSFLGRHNLSRVESANSPAPRFGTNAGVR